MGSFKYTIINDSFVSKLFCSKTSMDSQCNSANYFNLAHIRLPQVNEVICVDNLLEFRLQFDLTSYVCWRYSKPRALTHFKILLLPFNTNVAGTSKKAEFKPVKCYLEYLNECTKKLVVFKEFWIDENATETVVIEKFDTFLPKNRISFAKHFVYAKVWRVRLSTEARQSILASSLLASTIIDTIEMNQTQNSNLHNFHLELNVSNIEVKLNSINLNTNDLVLVNLSDLKTRMLINQFDQFTSVTFNAYAQLAVDYCEYKFLTIRPMLDPCQFKMNSKLSFQDPMSKLQDVFVDLDVNGLHLLVSQSGLVALKQLENEWQIQVFI